MTNCGSPARSTPAVASRIGATLLLIGFAAPAIAASSLSLGCGDDKHLHASGIHETADKFTSSDGDLQLVTVSGVAEKLSVLKSNSGAVKLSGTSRLSELLREYRSAAPDPATSSRSTAQRRSAALADALERRQQRSLAVTGDEAHTSDKPDVETRLPGISEQDSLIYRREMYRTDI